ncbi:MAG: Na+/H+ antiporter NhaC family protein [Desulfovibrionaceae bacterium]|nr:Na+/H+ antiporter NhaC family protein [Desulfovibrionaceae bacterium]
MIKGVCSVRIVIQIFAAIGFMTAAWRISGTMPLLISGILDLISPTFFYVCAFLACAGFSMLVGSSFTAASTLGVLLTLAAQASGLDMRITAGAVISGIFIGDRTSPLSSCIALISALTHQHTADITSKMMRTLSLPFLLTALFYGYFSSDASLALISKNTTLFASFDMGLQGVIPAAIVLLLSFFHFSVLKIMIWSLISAIFIAVCFQKISVFDTARMLLFGAEFSQDAELFNGGGLLSMASPTAIVMISSAWSGLLNVSGFTAFGKHAAIRLCRMVGPCCTMMIFSCAVGAICCNQTMTIVLVSSMCGGLYADSLRQAMHLGDSAVILPAIIPWCVSCSVPLAAIGADSASLLYAVFPCIASATCIGNDLLSRYQRSSS